MKLKYSLTEDDFLTHMLFIASSKKSIQSSRNKSRIVVPAVLFCFAIFAFITSSTLFIELIYILVALIWFLLYPKYSAYRYKNKCKKSISESYKNRVNVVSTLELQEESIVGISEIGESKIYLNQIDKITEIATHFLISLKYGETLIIPKNRKLEEGDAEIFTNDISNRIKLKVTRNLLWKWN